MRRIIRNCWKSACASDMAAKIIGTAFFTSTEGPLLVRWTLSAEQLKRGSRRLRKVVESIDFTSSDSENSKDPPSPPCQMTLPPFYSVCSHFLHQQSRPIQAIHWTLRSKRRNNRMATRQIFIKFDAKLEITVSNSSILTQN